MTPKQRRMKRMVAQYQKYVATYSDQLFYKDYSDKTFLDDMLYGIGLAFGPKKFQMSKGYDKWKKFLFNYLIEG